MLPPEERTHLAQRIGGKLERNKDIEEIGDGLPAPTPDTGKSSCSGVLFGCDYRALASQTARVSAPFPTGQIIDAVACEGDPDRAVAYRGNRGNGYTMGAVFGLKKEIPVNFQVRESAGPAR